MGPELFGDFFFTVLLFFWISCSVHFPWYFAAFWSWKVPFQRHLQHFEFEPSIFYGICNILVPIAAFYFSFSKEFNILVLELFLEYGILQLGLI